jgi:hypothetical protein
MKSIFKKVGALVGLLVIALGISLTPILTASAATRDCDSNAVIYCGTVNKYELRDKLNSGTGRTYQSASQLQDLFGHYGIYSKDYWRLVDGTVYSDGRVVVNGKVVHRNAKSMGRSYMAGSTKVSGFPYPIYLRPTSVSFRSSSIGALVRMNTNGTMQYAVLKSCGNIVPGVSYTEKLYWLTTNKYEDLNRDGIRQTNEPYLPNWTFDITGPNGYKRTVVTSINGGITATHLKAGTYTITERQQTGWTSTTGLTQTVTITNSNQSVHFGNARIVVVQSAGLRVIKFHDRDGDKIQDSNEERLSGWKFRVTGNNYDQIVTTNATGEAVINDLQPGTYTITEILVDGWVNTTGLTTERNIVDGTVETIMFGNRRPTKPGEKIKQTKLPTSGPVETAAMAFGSVSFSGVALAWAKSKKKLLDAFRK